ncbi:MAG: hypothetical protein IPN71_13730 [Fibrobacteres bacterium]|nr:hypothetical protein [Fibrobacterota bacterium]
MKATTLTSFLPCLLAGFATAQITVNDFDFSGATTPSYSGAIPRSVQAMRFTSWSHPAGSLIPNWSFENSQQFWMNGLNGISRVRSYSAKSGYFVAQAVPGTYLTFSGLKSQGIPIISEQLYTLSFYHKGSTGGGNFCPRFWYFDRAGSLIDNSVPSTAYSSTSDWTIRQISFTPPVGADYLIIELLSGTVPASATSFYLDDVMLTEGTATDPAQDRNAVLTNVSISDPSGIALQSASGSGKDASLTVSAVDYDIFWRKQKFYLPFQASRTSTLYEIASPLTRAKSAWSSAGNTPFTQVAYPDPMNKGQSRAASTGDLWALNASPNHVAASGSILVSSVPTSGAGMPSAPFETYYESTAGEKLYVLNWSRDPDGYYNAQWTDAIGKVVASGRQMNQNGVTNPNQWKWAFTTYQYYINGRLKSVTVPPTASGQVPPTVTSYDFQGRVIAKSSPDEGLTRFWYDQAGRLRYWQTAKLKQDKWVAWRSYDALGRPIVEGTALPKDGTNLEDLQSMAESPLSENSSTFFQSKVVQRGWIYDKLEASEFQTLTSVPLSTVVGVATFAGSNGEGKLVAQYNLNPYFAATPTGGVDVTSPAARLVVDLYSYDAQGRQKVSGKYIGAIQDASLRSQAVEYSYDSLGRVRQLDVYSNMLQTTLPKFLRSKISNYTYTYDDKNRVTQIMDGAQYVARYTYDAFGRTTDVGMGGTSTTNALAIRMAYDYKSRLKSMSSSAANVVQSQELLGYESPVISPANTGITPTPRYAGQITQTVQQFGTDQNLVNPAAPKGSQSVKAVQYTYDVQGRMTNAQTFLPTAAVSYGQGGVPNLEAPYNPASEPTLSASYAYDDNDRIDSMKYGSSGVTKYKYKAGTNRLDNVNGTVVPGSTRNASAAGNFRYDANGAMTGDGSTSNSLTYDYAGKLLRISRTAPYLQSSLHAIYDADGYMVSYTRISANPSAQGIESKHHYIRINGSAFKEFHEAWTRGTTTSPSIYNSTAMVVNLYGRSSVIGRRFPGTSLQRQFMVKDHQGSTVRLVNEDGTVAGAYDYYAYGDLRVLTGEATNLTSKWTGKEDFAEFGLMYFGARWYDPELGTWISPDPAHQFNSPYATTNSPIVGGDANGLLWDELGGILSDAWGGISSAGSYIYRASGNLKDDAVSWSRDACANGCSAKVSSDGTASFSYGTSSGQALNVTIGQTAEMLTQSRLQSGMPNPYMNLIGQSYVMHSTEHPQGAIWGDYEPSNGEERDATFEEMLFVSRWKYEVRQYMKNHPDANPVHGEFGMSIDESGTIGGARGKSGPAYSRKGFVEYEFTNGREIHSHCQRCYKDGKDPGYSAQSDWVRIPSFYDYRAADQFRSMGGKGSYLNVPSGEIYKYEGGPNYRYYRIRDIYGLEY